MYSNKVACVHVGIFGFPMRFCADALRSFIENMCALHNEKALSSIHGNSQRAENQCSAGFIGVELTELKKKRDAMYIQRVPPLVLFKYIHIPLPFLPGISIQFIKWGSHPGARCFPLFNSLTELMPVARNKSFRHSRVCREVDKYT